jgi:hypothetical protein
MPPSTILISKYHPECYDELPEEHEDNAIVLVFECVPEQYRRVCEWFSKHYDHQSPVYRYLIPCKAVENYDDTLPDPDEIIESAASGGPIPEIAHVRRDVQPTWDLGDYAYAGLDEANYQGRFECFPSSFRYSLSRINVDVIDGTFISQLTTAEWPQPTENSLSGFYRDGYCSERLKLFPRLLSGTSRLQDEILALVTKGETSVAIILNSVSAKTFVSMELCERQLHGLCIGNLPFIKRRGGTVEIIKPLPYSCIPLRLVNGDCPLPVKKVAEVMRDYLSAAKPIELMDEVKPACWPYKFGRGVPPEGTAPEYEDGTIAVTTVHIDEETSRVTLPYGISPYSAIDAIHVSWKTIDGVVYGELKDPSRKWTIQLVRKTTLLDMSDNIVTFRKPSDYVKAWITAYTNRAIDERPSKIDFEAKRQMFIVALHLQKTYQDLRTKQKKVWFFQQNDAKKRAEIEDTYGREYVEPFMNIPVSQIGPEILDEIEEENACVASMPVSLKRARAGEYYNATHELLEEIRSILR